MQAHPFILGIDPSLKATGIAILSYDEKTIQTTVIHREIPDKSFYGLYKVSVSIAREIDSAVTSMLSGGDEPEVIMEFAQPIGQWAAGLSALDALILRVLLPRVSVILVSPKVRMRLCGKGNLTKPQVRDEALAVADANSFTITTYDPARTFRSRCRVSYDEADALLLAMYLAHNRVNPLTLLVPKVERWDLKEDYCG